MDIEGIAVGQEEERDHRIVEEITKAAFDYPDRIERGRSGTRIKISRWYPRTQLGGRAGKWRDRV